MNSPRYLFLSLLTLLASLCLLATPAWADAPVTLGGRGGLARIEQPASALAAPITLTQSLDPNKLEIPNTVGCYSSSGGYTAQNSYWRRFDLDAQFGLTQTLTLQTFEFAVEEATADFDITVAAYALTGTFQLSNLVPIHSGVVTLGSDDSGTFVTVPLSGAIEPNLDLVMAIHVPDGQPIPAEFWVGSNSMGQSAPSYITAPLCNFDEPTDLSTVGAPDVHILMTVGGDTGTPTAVALSDIVASPAPSIPWLPLLLAAGLSGAIGLRTVLRATRN